MKANVANLREENLAALPHVLSTPMLPKDLADGCAFLRNILAKELKDEVAQQQNIYAAVMARFAQDCSHFTREPEPKPAVVKDVTVDIDSHVVTVKFNRCSDEDLVNLDEAAPFVLKWFTCLQHDVFRKSWQTYYMERMVLKKDAVYDVDARAETLSTAQQKRAMFTVQTPVGLFPLNVSVNILNDKKGSLAHMHKVRFHAVVVSSCVVNKHQIVR